MISKTLLVMFFLFLRHCEGLASFGDKNQWLAPPAAGSAYADFEKPFIPTQLPGPDDLVHYAEMLGQILTPGNESLFLRYANGKEIPLAILYATPPIFWEKIPQLLERNEWFRQFVEDKKTREIALKALTEAQKRINEGMKRAREIKGQVTIEIRPWITFFEYMDEWEVNEFLPKVSGYILDGKILEMEARSGVFIRELAGSFQVPAAGNKKKGKKKGGAAKRFFAVCHPSEATSHARNEGKSLGVDFSSGTLIETGWPKKGDFSTILLKDIIDKCHEFKRKEKYLILFQSFMEASRLLRREGRLLLTAAADSDVVGDHIDLLIQFAHAFNFEVMGDGEVKSLRSVFPAKILILRKVGEASCQFDPIAKTARAENPVTGDSVQIDNIQDISMVGRALAALAAAGPRETPAGIEKVTPEEELRRLARQEALIVGPSGFIRGPFQELGSETLKRVKERKRVLLTEMSL